MDTEKEADAPRGESAEHRILFNNNRLLDAALEYAERGWRVLPLQPRQKCPAVRTGRNHSAATCDPAEITRWWQANPNANVGIATGSRSRLVILDIDPRNGGDASLQRLVEWYGSGFLDTRTVLTGGGGKHLYFAYDGPPLKSGPIAPGLDLLADGKLAVAPPSAHPNGIPYRWEDAATPMQPLPDWLKEPALRRIKEGSRNDSLTREAGSLRAHGFGPDALAQQLQITNAACCAPPLPPQEVARIARSIGSRPAGYPQTDLGNAERLIERHGQGLRYCPEVGKWLHWDGERWLWDEDGGIDRRAADTVRAIYPQAQHIADEDARRRLASHALKSEAAARIDAMIRLARTRPGVPLPITSLDADPMLLGVVGGTLDLTTGQFRTARREDYLTKRAPVQFDPSAKCPLWLRFLDEIFARDAELIAFVQRIAGYCLTGDTREQCLFVLHGHGANGKSVLIRVMQALLGDYALTMQPATLMETRRGGGASNDIARLRGARVVTASEPNEGCVLAEAVVKQLTGEDKVSCRFLYQEFFEYTPQFKILLTTNHKPIIKGDDHAIWRRLHLIPFEVTISAERQDKELARKLIAEELPGILNWALEGLEEWRIGGLAPPEVVVAATKAYRADMDILADWIEECCMVHSRIPFTPNNDLYRSYSDYCRSGNLPLMNNRAFGRKLGERGFQAAKGPGGVRGFRGLSLKGSVGASLKAAS